VIQTDHWEAWGFCCGLPIGLNETGGAGRLVLAGFIPLSSVHPCIINNPQKYRKSLRYVGFKEIN
jgi:hypothetical protein